MSTPTAEMQFTQTATGRLEVNKVETGAALQWLSSGFDDFKRTPALSLLYGVLFASLTAGVFLLVTNVPWYAVAYLTGLVVMGPFILKKSVKNGIIPRSP